jgi:hypothetical protein
MAVALVWRGDEGHVMTAMLPMETVGYDMDALKELASIARLITYARQSAKELNADFPVWCLDLALGAVLQEMYSSGQQIPLLEDGAEQSSVAPRH